MNVSRFVVLAGCLAAAAICTGLGFWQLGRLEEKNAWIAQMRQRMAEPEIALGQILARPDVASFRAVRAQGRYLRDETVYVVNQLHERVGGVRVLTPLETAGEPPRRVLVDRGFLGHHERSDFEAAEQAESGETRVDGVLHRLERRTLPEGTGPRTDDEARRADWLRIDLAGLERQLALPLEPWLLVRSSGESPPLALPREPQSTVNHLHYAITWFASAAVGAIGGLVYAFGRR